MMHRYAYLLDTIAILLSLAGLYWFAASFFLAKRSLPERSSCDEASQLLEDYLGLSKDETRSLRKSGILAAEGLPRSGCWMDRTVDSLVILVVDALRFDFAYYNLPDSVGRRLKESETNKHSGSRLFQFVADPPTVTMQRLKGLTTGGLPTFADISANFGGATVEEDSWIQLVTTTDWRARGLTYPSRMGFVGDDTWEDLFPGYFNESFPYPSFNTRDLDTVDNGCLAHIPDLLRRIRTQQTVSEDDFEVVVVHFLGVDHVGHTYGPHNEHMDRKLRQMDTVLSNILDRLDGSDSCHVTYIFGDHGMTEDGNHGGGSPEEMNAALFVHSSPKCGNMYNSLQLEQDATSELVQEADFSSIHQIDLVPTISVLLGIPIPYANLGSFVPSLVAGQDVRQAAAALALNAAQIWRYLTVYSKTANKLPDLSNLAATLNTAVDVYKEALQSTDVVDTDLYQRAASLLKIFLREALDLGQRVWTRFDDFGMVGGIVTLGLGLVIYGFRGVSLRISLPKSLGQFWEVVAAFTFMGYHCVLLSFSNSYILEEEHSIMFSLTVICMVLAFRLWSSPVKSRMHIYLLLLALTARLNEALITGHGLDPQIRKHLAHNRLVFFGSLLALLVTRWQLHVSSVVRSYSHCVVDCATLLLLGASWSEKRVLDPERNGFWFCRAALVLLCTGIFSVAVEASGVDSGQKTLNQNDGARHRVSGSHSMLAVIKGLIATMAVTGPSAAASLVFYSVQVSVLYVLSNSSQTQPFVTASLLKLVTRHVFFATNHGCAFNRLQYSAAFIATKEFYFSTGGISLFLNTFGWEMSGLALAWMLSSQEKSRSIWRIYGVLQLTEAIASCISVSLLRRHLMVWDIYAPHFLFTAIFTVLNALFQLTVTLIDEFI